MASSEIKKYLGNPFYEAPDCLIYCGDCLWRTENKFMGLCQ